MGRMPRLKRKLDDTAFAEHCQRRVAESGTNLDTIVQKAVELAPSAPIFRRVTLETAKKHADALDSFDDFLFAAADPVFVGDIPITSVEDWPSRYPDIDHLEGFLRWAAEDAVLRGATMHCRVFRDLDRHLHAGMKRKFGIVEPRQTRVAVEELIERVAADLNLPRGGRNRPKALLTRAVYMTLVSTIWTGKLRWRVRRRVTTATYSALGTQTALRPSGLLRIKGGLNDSRRRGATYGQFSIYVIPRSKDCNGLVGYYHPIFDKRRNAPERHLPITSAPTPGTSSLFMVLISLIADGGLTVSGLRTLMSPEFVEKGAVRLRFTAAWRQKPVFPNARNRPASTENMRRSLRQLSTACGLATAVTPYSFRHLAAWAAFQAGSSLSHIRLLLGHQMGTSSVRYYLGVEDEQVPDALLPSDPIRGEEIRLRERDDVPPTPDSIEPWRVDPQEIEKTIELLQSQHERLQINVEEQPSMQVQTESSVPAPLQIAELGRTSTGEIRTVMCSPWDDFRIPRDIDVLSKLFVTSTNGQGGPGLEEKEASDGEFSGDDPSTDGTLSELSCDSEAESDDFRGACDQVRAEDDDDKEV